MTPNVKEEQLEGQRWSLKAIALTFESSKRQTANTEVVFRRHTLLQVCVHVFLFLFLTHDISYTITGVLHKHLHSISKSGRKEKKYSQLRNKFNGKQREENGKRGGGN